MADEEAPAVTTTPDYTQLTQARVPLESASVAFSSRDASGRIPIVLVPDRPNRIRNDFLAAAVVVFLAAFLIDLIWNPWWAFVLAVPISLILVILAVLRSFFVYIPEGISVLLARGGKHFKTIGAGRHFVPPWLAISHMVTRREIPFDVPVVSMPTSDNVRANVDILVTFTITDPYRFVYSISADDFDQVFEAAATEALRERIRSISSADIASLRQDDMTEVQTALNVRAQTYGTEVGHISVTYAQPPADFVQTEEARQLNIVQQAEQAERQALAERRLAEEASLARLRVLAQADRERELLKAAMEQAEARRRVVELEAEAEDLRLARLQERLEKYPLAAQWEAEALSLDVARALAGNTRAVVQVGGASQIAEAFTVRGILHDDALDSPPSESTGAAESVQLPPAQRGR